MSQSQQQSDESVDPSGMVRWEIDIECPGCGQWRIGSVLRPAGQSAPLCIKELCDVCRGLSQ